MYYVYSTTDKIFNISNETKNRKNFIGPIGSDPNSIPGSITLTDGKKDTTYSNAYFYSSIFFYLNGCLYYYDYQTGTFKTDNLSTDINDPDIAGF